MLALTCKPNWQAFLATKPAPSMTLGFEVFVQLVMAAMTTLPCLSSAGCPLNENFATLSWNSFGTAKPCQVIMDVKLTTEINEVLHNTSLRTLNVRQHRDTLELGGTKSYWIKVTIKGQKIANQLKISPIMSKNDLVSTQMHAKSRPEHWYSSVVNLKVAMDFHRNWHYLLLIVGNTVITWLQFS